MSAMSCDHVDLGDWRGVPLPPGFTQFHPRSPKVTQAGVPGKPGFGLLGWNVTQAGVPGKPGVPDKPRGWLVGVEARSWLVGVEAPFGLAGWLRP